MSDDIDLRALREQIVANQRIIDELNQSIQRKTQEVRVVQEIAAEINATLELDAILQHILHAMDRVFGFRHAMVLLKDPGADRLLVAASHGYSDPGIGAEVLIGQGVIGVVAKRKKLMRMANLGEHRAYAAAVREQMERAGQLEVLARKVSLPGLPEVESQIAIPLLAKDALIGVLAVESKNPQAFDAVDEQLVGLLAAQAASAVHNARLYEAEERRRRELSDAHARLAALNEDLEQKIDERTAALQASNRQLGEALAGMRLEQARSVELLRMTAPPEIIPLLLEGRVPPQRLTATMLFADLQGFTQHSSTLEPDELFAQLGDFFDRVGAHIQRYRGYVTKTTGDGVMAVFGVPFANHTHACDAVLAALAMQEDLARGFQLPMRVGINTGTITAGLLGPSDKLLYDAQGDAVNVAARMEKLAPPGGIAVSPETHAVVAPFFSAERMGEHQVKGKGVICCWRITGLLPLLADRRRVDEGSVFAAQFADIEREVQAFRDQKLAAVDFRSVQSRDGALGHSESVAAIALGLRRFLLDGRAGTRTADVSAVAEDDLLTLALLHDLGKHAIDPARLNGGLLAGAQREKLVHDLLASTVQAFEQLGLDRLRDPLERLVRFEASRGAVEESDALVLLVAVADMYDALVAPKLYKGRPWSIQGTLEELSRSPHALRKPCPIFQGLIELMRPPGAAVTVRARGEAIFR